MNMTKNLDHVLSIKPYQFRELFPESWKKNLSLAIFSATEKLNGMVFELYLRECVEKIENKRERASPPYIRIRGFIPYNKSKNLKIFDVKKAKWV